MASTNFDHALGMWIEKPRTLNLNWLVFLRGLVERGELEHREAGPAEGPALKLLREEARVDALACPAYSGKA